MLFLACWNETVLPVYSNLVRPTSQNENTTSNEQVPKSNKMTRAFAECSENQSKLRKLGSRSLSVRRTNQNSGNWVRVRWVFGEPIKTLETRLAFGSPVFASKLNESRSVRQHCVSNALKSNKMAHAFAECSENQSNSWNSVRRSNTMQYVNKP